MPNNITRRRFLSHAAASASGLALGTHSIGFPGNAQKLGVATDLMEEVLNYRKIDSHAHVYFTPDSPEIQIDFADRLGIEKLVISRPMAPGSKGLPEEFIQCNDLIIDALSKYPKRFIGQATINPTYLNASMDEIDRCMDNGMVGLKLYNHVKLSDPIFYPIIEKFIDLKMIILMHMGIGRSRVVWDAREPKNVSTPEDFVIAAKRFPEAIFQLAHLGGGGDWLDACKAVKPYNNVYVDLSGSNNEADILPFALEQLGEDRLLFGCDNSFYQGVGHVLAADLSETQREKIFLVTTIRF